MKILCLIENLGSGGAERQLTGLASMLNNKGHEVEVAYYVKKEFYKPQLVENGVGCRYLSNAADSRKRFFVIRRYIREYSPDTIISYSNSPSMITCLLKMLGARFNLIVSERNTTQILTTRERAKFMLFRFADKIVPNSQSQALFINSHYPNLSDKIKVITNFVDTIKFSPSDYQSINQGIIKMICVGRLMPQKNIPLFIKAISRVVKDGYKIHVAWYGQDLKDSYAEECHRTINENHLGGIFEFYSPSSTIQDEYQKADVFCLPSLYEGFPNVLCEAMSCGKPVLCSRVCDNPSIAKEGVNGLLFDPCNVEDITSAIEQYLDLPQEKQKEMGENSRTIAVELFSEESFIQKYISIL